MKQLLKDIKTMSCRRMKISMRNLDTILTSVVTPSLMMILFVYVLGGSMHVEEMSYVNYIVPGILIQCIGQCGSNTAIAMNNDMHSGIIHRFYTMPIIKSSIFIGHIVEAFFRSVVTTMIVLVIAWIVGFRPDMQMQNVLLIILLLAMFILMISWISILFGLLAQGPEGAGACAVFISVLPYLSSGFVSVDSLPKVLEIFAKYQPMTPIIDSLRALFMGEVLQIQDYLLGMMWCIIFIVICFGLSKVLFKRKLQTS